MKLRLLLMAILLALAGCSTYGLPPSGFLYSEVSYPAGDKAKLDAATAEKMGRSICRGVLGAVAWGDCSLEAAMKQGGLTKVHHVEHKTIQIYVFFSRFDTLAYGE